MIVIFRYSILVFCLALAGCANEQTARGSEVDGDTTLNRVIVLGMIHGRHETSTRYSTSRVKGVIEAIDPDYVLTEIPPDLFAEAVRSFEEDGQVTEPRVMRFPEYTGALFPLTLRMDFEIIPTAGWTQAMADFRRDALDALSKDASRREDWHTYRAAIEEMEAAIGERGDDPYFIHSDEYDALTKTGLTPYAQLFANDLGVGDWETINAAHYRLIENALDRHTGEGATILITFGAGHKYWFLEQLRRRTDIELVSALPYFDRVPMEQE
jgi:hypothetical protein